MEFKTYQDMLDFCESKRGESRFCNCSRSDGCEVFRGGCGNRFVVGKGDE